MMRNLVTTYTDIRIALISDELTSLALDESSVKVFQIKDKNWFQLFKIFKPDVILVESVWRGYKDAWRYKIANYPDYPERKSKQDPNTVKIKMG